MLRFQNGYEVMLINTLGIWYASVSKDGKHLLELLRNDPDRDVMVNHVRQVMSFVGAKEIR
jgi:hypothetical protein